MSPCTNAPQPQRLRPGGTAGTQNRQKTNERAEAASRATAEGVIVEYQELDWPRANRAVKQRIDGRDWGT